MYKSILAYAAAGLGLIGIVGSVLSAAKTTASPDRVERGKYLSAIMVCADCHTTGSLLGKADPQRHLAGSQVGFLVPDLGIFYPPNLTPDRETGIGTWSEADIVKAVREGVRPDGRILAPMMPYLHYAALTDADAWSLAAYLKSLEPIRHQVPPIVAAGEKPAAPYLKVVMPD